MNRDIPRDFSQPREIHPSRNDNSIISTFSTRLSLSSKSSFFSASRPKYSCRRHNFPFFAFVFFTILPFFQIFLKNKGIEEIFKSEYSRVLARAPSRILIGANIATLKRYGGLFRSPLGINHFFILSLPPAPSPKLSLYMWQTRVRPSDAQFFFSGLFTTRIFIMPIREFLK